VRVSGPVRSQGRRLGSWPRVPSIAAGNWVNAVNVVEILERLASIKVQHKQLLVLSTIARSFPTDTDAVLFGYGMGVSRSQRKRFQLTTFLSYSYL